MAGLLAGSLRAPSAPAAVAWLRRWAGVCLRCYWQRPPRPATHGGAACRVTLEWTTRHTGLAVLEDAMATLTCPGCGAAVSHDDLICFTCGTNLPRRGPVEEEAAPPTVMQEYLRPDVGAAPGKAPATGPISPVVLRLAFPAGNVDVPAGTSLVLGRDPAESLVAAAF